MPDQFVQWMCPPSVHEDGQCEIDGGRRRLAIGGAAHAGARSSPTSGKYLEIEPPERLVFTWAHHETDDFASPRGQERTVTSSSRRWATAPR